MTAFPRVWAELLALDFCKDPRAVKDELRILRSRLLPLSPPSHAFFSQTLRTVAHLVALADLDHWRAAAGRLAPRAAHADMSTGGLLARSIWQLLTDFHVEDSGVAPLATDGQLRALACSAGGTASTAAAAAAAVFPTPLRATKPALVLHLVARAPRSDRELARALARGDRTHSRLFSVARWLCERGAAAAADGAYAGESEDDEGADEEGGVNGGVGDHRGGAAAATTAGAQASARALLLGALLERWGAALPSDVAVRWICSRQAQGDGVAASAGVCARATPPNATSP